jgi:hypothetical protein
LLICYHLLQSIILSVQVVHFWWGKEMGACSYPVNPFITEIKNATLYPCPTFPRCNRHRNKLTFHILSNLDSVFGCNQEVIHITCWKMKWSGDNAWLNRIYIQMTIKQNKIPQFISATRQHWPDGFPQYQIYLKLTWQCFVSTAT